MNARWPRLMKLKSAAEYVDMTPATFERAIIAGQLPHGKPIGGKEHWDRLALDKAIDALMGQVDQPAYLRKFEARYGQTA